MVVPSTANKAMSNNRLGRFLSPDPYGQYHSSYAGMGNNPINAIDPSGGFTFTPFWISAFQTFATRMTQSNWAWALGALYGWINHRDKAITASYYERSAMGVFIYGQADAFVASTTSSYSPFFAGNNEVDAIEVALSQAISASFVYISEYINNNATTNEEIIADINDLILEMSSMYGGKSGKGTETPPQFANLEEVISYLSEHPNDIYAQICYAELGGEISLTPGERLAAKINNWGPILVVGGRPIPNVMYKAGAVAFSVGGNFVGAEKGYGSLLMLQGEDYGEMALFSEIAGGGGTGLSAGIDIIRIDYTGGNENIKLSMIYGSRSKLYLGAGVVGSLGLSSSWSKPIDGNRLISNSINIGVGIAPLIDGGFNSGEVQHKNLNDLWLWRIAPYILGPFY